MARADAETQTLYTTLHFIYRRNTNPITGLTHRPHGSDWVSLERTMHRLLVLRGTIATGQSIQEDPWEFFLKEFAPLGTRRPVNERIASGQGQGQGPGQGQRRSVLLNPLPSSITSISTSTAANGGNDGEEPRGRTLHRAQDQHQHQQQNAQDPQASQTHNGQDGCQDEGGETGTGNGNRNPNLSFLERIFQRLQLSPQQRQQGSARHSDPHIRFLDAQFPRRGRPARRYPTSPAPAARLRLRHNTTRRLAAWETHYE